jgi:fructose-1,6-bisphosphatase/inositol monophosphatase family enzyme
LHHGYAIASDYPGKVRGVGSGVAHLCYVATGSADATLMGHEYVWDLAAGAALLHCTGGVLKYLHGPPVSLDALLRSGERAPYPMLAGHPEAVARFEALISYDAPAQVEGS